MSGTFTQTALAERLANTVKAAKTVAFVHWNAEEGEDRARRLRDLGYQVELESGPAQGAAILRQLRQTPPAALVVGLDRLPMQGRDLGVAIRTGNQTRQIPLVFAGGEPLKVDRVRQTLPDAIYTSWAGIATALKRALSKPAADPMVPGSNLAGYSGTPLPKKLGIKPDTSLALLNEPEGFLELLRELPPGASVAHRIASNTDLAIWFVRSIAELTSKVQSVADGVAAAESCRLWIAWAKRTSPLATDVSETAVRTTALAVGLVDYKVAALDADWSGLLFAPRKEQPDGKKRQARASQRALVG